MFKHTIKYTDYNGVEREEQFFFNLSKAELMEMELSTQAGVEEMIRMMIATNDNAKITQTYKNLILKSYGIKSEDGRRFINSQQLIEEFEQSEAYSELFMELLSNNKLQQDFINGIISGTNVPNMDEKEAIKKLKELGYDTSRMEKALEENPIKNENNNGAEVVDMPKKTPEEHK
jgi:hypothetical protein